MATIYLVVKGNRGEAEQAARKHNVNALFEGLCSEWSETIMRAPGLDLDNVRTWWHETHPGTMPPYDDGTLLSYSHMPDLND